MTNTEIHMKHISEYAREIGEELFMYKGGDSEKVRVYVESNIVDWYTRGIAPSEVAAWISLACGMTEKGPDES